MNCQEFWNRLPNPPGTRPDPGVEHREHLAHCAACAAHFARQAELAQGLRRLAQNSSGIQASPRVEARLLRAFRGQNIDPVRERFRWPVPLAWAATVLLA